ncbi:uncharacterized protein LOC130438813 [Triplophysa dalaica]|uniref:uncharacterized protein LOC130438813 n=1 Tax=Triplophysa dalaica TaxID=1582913 RepID=UPI0024DFDD8E|nr:uncharacterized protein LOC130438813 [Triplophysa dalaica]XP_056626983.1 uncharacterized protein LOC130438813 [Triplophysa dalaica]
MCAGCVVLLVLLVWTFTSACGADDGFNITCRNVTGRVGKESTLNCDVSYLNKTCCMMMFKIINTPDTTICKEDFRKDFGNDPCLQFTSLPCPYIANEVMTSTFKFILHTRCGNKTAGFTVNITESVDDTGGPKDDPTKETPVQTWIVVIIAAIICCVIYILGLLLIRNQNAKATYSALITGTIPLEQHGVKCLAQGHTGGGCWDRTSNLLITSSVV